MSFNPGIAVGSSTFTDLVYADDTALLLPSATNAAASLESFGKWASYVSLNISWPKTNLQNIGSDPKRPDISVDGNIIKVVNSSVYLGSSQSSDGQCCPDQICRIGLAYAVMSSLNRIWSDKRLTLNTKSMYHTPVLAVLLYATSRCQDSGCLSPQMPETTSWNMMVRSSLKWRSSATSRPDFTVPSAIHQTHFDLTSIYLQTRLFNWKSVHHLVDLLTVHGVTHLAAPKTSGSTNSRDDCPFHRRPLEARCRPWTQWCSDATAPAGYVNYEDDGISPADATGYIAICCFGSPHCMHAPVDAVSADVVRPKLLGINQIFLVSLAAAEQSETVMQHD